MSYFDDYVADGMCCECCGTYMGNEPGYVRRCDGCQPKPKPKPVARKVKA